MSDDLFTSIDPTVAPASEGSVYEALVGDGLKYRDQEALARAALEKDTHIARIEKENRELREQGNSQKRLEEMVDRLSRKTEDTTITPAAPQPAERVEREIPDVRRLVQEELTVQSEASKRKGNKDFVRSELTKMYGNDYQPKLREKIQSLEVGEAFLNTMAETNPKAFLRLMTDQMPMERDIIAPPRSSTQVQSAPAPTGVRTEAYYKNLQKSNPASYKSAQVQLQRHNDAIRLGAAFFDA